MYYTDSVADRMRDLFKQAKATHTTVYATHDGLVACAPCARRSVVVSPYSSFEKWASRHTHVLPGEWGAFVLDGMLYFAGKTGYYRRFSPYESDLVVDEASFWHNYARAQKLGQVL